MYYQKALKTQTAHVLSFYNFLKNIFDVLSKSTKNPNSTRFILYNFLKNIFDVLSKSTR